MIILNAGMGSWQSANKEGIDGERKKPKLFSDAQVCGPCAQDDDRKEGTSTEGIAGPERGNRVDSWSIGVECFDRWH